MSKQDDHLSRRAFLKRLGMGLGSVALVSMEPLSCAARKLTYNTPAKGINQFNDDVVNMTYRINRSTQDKVSLLGYGMMRLPKADGHIDQDMVNQEVDYAIAHGINYFDTAPVYGRSEEATGIALSRHPRKSYYLATKMSNFQDLTLEGAKAMYENSRKLLKTDYFDYYLLHSVGGGDGMGLFNRRFIDNGVLDFLCKERDAGRIRNLGFSYHGDVKVFDWLVDHKDEYGLTFVQIEMNYIDWRHAKQGNKKDADAEYLYNKCEKAGLQCVVMEPLLGGRLAKVPDDVRQEFADRRPDASPASWAFRWVGTHPNILVALSGMTTMDVLQENIKTFSPLDPCTSVENDFIAKIADQMAGIPVIPCTSCHYCMPCPYGVAIPDNFAVYNDCVNDKSLPNDKTAPDYEQKLKAFQDRYAKAIPQAGRADQCVDCEACLPKCPQQIRIPNQMARIVELLPMIEG
ncbi:MAG: aldo/keto reductase [Prevotella sp.]|nr:aldo/keto reductase [Prevotella sp.]